jgi:hypothetical protein
MDGWCPIECLRLIECALASLGEYLSSSFEIDDTRSKLKAALVRPIKICQLFLDENCEESDIFLDAGRKLGVILRELNDKMGPDSHTQLTITITYAVQ